MDTVWNEATAVNSTTVDEALNIIYDALCFGFQFKVENGKIYWCDEL